jgi:SAM-dependent methyltransferase
LDIVDGVVTRSPGPFIGAALISIVAGLGWYASRREKFVVWDRLLDQLNLRGDERLLDMGCGRGAVLLMAAQRLTTGRAVGVDLWRVRDQSGNAADATERNARTEGVADRVELHTADMTALPFEPDTFDLVLSNIAIHNIKGLPGRDAVTSYARAVVAGRIIASRLVRLAAERHLRDLEQQQERGLVWRPDKAGDVIRFFEEVLYLPDVQTDDEDAPAEAIPFRLNGFQKFIVGSVFGWYRWPGIGDSRRSTPTQDGVPARAAPARPRCDDSASPISRPRKDPGRRRWPPVSRSMASWSPVASAPRSSARR